MKNKKGQAMIWAIFIALILVLGVGGFALYKSDVFQKTTETETGQTEDQAKCADASGILTVNELSAIDGGTAPTSSTITAGIVGKAVSTTVISGTTTFPVGADVNVLVSDIDSIDKSFNFVMPCGGYTLDAKLYYSTLDNPSIEIQDKNSNTLSNAIADGAVNISDVTAGGVMKAKVIFSGTALESSGDGLYVLEFAAGSGVNISDVTLGSLASVTVPQAYTPVTAGGELVAFKVPAIIGGTESEYALNVQLEGTNDLAGGVYTAWFNEQEFIDDDLSISTGVEDASGDAKYENTVTYNFFINSA